MRIVAKKKDVAQNRLDGYFWDIEKVGSNYSSHNITTCSYGVVMSLKDDKKIYNIAEIE